MESDLGRRIHEVKGLEVIGYADRLPTDISVPHRCPPIFHLLNNQELYLFPPFRLVDNLVIDGAITSNDEFRDYVAKERVTLFSQPIPAISQGTLWIDEQNQIHYGPHDRENKFLHEKAAKKYFSGLSALTRGRFDEALRDARWASAANERSVHTLALEAAALILQGKSDSTELIKDVANEQPDGFIFDEAVLELVKRGNYDLR